MMTCDRVRENQQYVGDIDFEIGAFIATSGIYTTNNRRIGNVKVAIFRQEPMRAEGRKESPTTVYVLIR